MSYHKLKIKWLLVILFFIFVEKAKSLDDMCGDWNMDHGSKPPEKEFQCENKINLQYGNSEGILESNEFDDGSGDDSGLEEDWPWLGMLTSVDDPDQKSLGVVVAPDVVITDLTFEEVEEVAQLRFTLKTGFEASVHTFLVKRSPDLLVITLDAPIPNDQFRPVCVPPQGYVSKVIKTNSCQQESSKIVKVNFRDGNIDKSLEPIINEYTCGERTFESETCSERMMSNSDNCLKPDEKFLKSIFNINSTKGSEKNSEFYTCHKNILKAREKCELDLLADESRCKDTKVKACSIFLKKSDTKNKKNQCVPEINKKAKCIVDQFGNSTFPFQGVNCLHDFITMPNCAKHIRKPGLKSLGKTWANDPCKKVKKKWKRTKCYKKDENKYLKKKPYDNNWSVSMVKEVDQIGSCILKKTGCSSCGVEGNDICTSGNVSSGSDMLFWFDSCRSKWFFLGPSTSTSPECEESLRIHANVEKGTEYIRNSIWSKVPKVELYPRPIIVVLGPTGVGKSTTANSLISGHAKNSQCFSTGGGTKSKTRRSSWRMGKWLGVGNCVTLVDTPGTDDTSGPHQDYENIKKLMETLKYDLKNIDVFLVMFKENSLRFVESMRKALDLFISIFGETFWDNVITEFTFAGFSVSDLRGRYERICAECKESMSSDSLNIDNNDDDLDCSGDETDDDINDSGSGSGCDDGNDGQQGENTKCSILGADAVKGSHFFKVGSLENENWKNLDKDTDYISDQDSYLKSCGWSSNNDVYDKADYATRKIKEMDWNAEYSSNFKVLENKNIPTVFIHPVYDRNDLRQCQAFKRETSKLWNLIGSMTPFQCSEKCEAPDGYFMGLPHIFSDRDIFAKQNSPFSISCSVWNGVEITGLMERDITWFHGWKLLEIDGVKWSSRIFPKSYDSKSSDDETEIELIFHQTYTRDAGLYSCVLPGVKDIESLKFEKKCARLEKETIEGSIGGSISNANIICSLPMTEVEYMAKQDLVQWYQAREIDSKMDSADFNTNLVKQADQYAISKLTLMKAKTDLEGSYACKSPGGFSNEVRLKIKIDASWAQWGDWSSCSQTCTGRHGHHGSKSRSRECIPGENSEVTCDQLDAKDGIDTSPCGTVCCPTDGKVLNWQSWGPCSKTCSNDEEIPGTKTRKRECTPPSLAPCPGNPCEDVLHQYVHCNSHSEKPCPINGGYSSWSEWSKCKVDHSVKNCSGRMERERLCNNPTPKHGGLPCEGATKDIQIDKIFCDPTCAQDCECDPEWPEKWGPCSITCGNCGELFCEEGIQNRRRSCSKETCVDGKCGETCLEKYGSNAEIDERVCTVPHCPKDGFCTEWSGWSGCDPHTGTHVRRRTIIPPEFGGHACTGSSEQVENCPVDCSCDGVDWGEMSSCSVTCGIGYKVARRGCRGSLNGGKRCTKDDQEIQIGCENRRCPVIIEGNWGPWSEYSECSAACGGGHKQRTRPCTFRGISDFDEDYDTQVPCSGSGVQNTGENSCNNKECSISTLIFLMDTSGSFQGTDTNSAFNLSRLLLNGLEDDAIIVPKYQLVEVNDPSVTKRKAITDRKAFEKQLFNLYNNSHGSGGDWAERSFKALAKPYALDAAADGAVVCLFTDAGTHDLNKTAEIIKLRDEKDIQIFVFLTPDYTIYGRGEESYRAYQNISKRHTYIMNETHPDTILNLVKKYLKNMEPDCQTLGGPPRWGDYPSECQFPFTYKNITYENCTSVDHNQPWCSTVTDETKKYIEGKWGNCGDCSGKVNRMCTNYTTLSDPWRKVSDAGHSSKMDDSALIRGWYRFNVTGAGKIPTSPPNGSNNEVGNDICGTGGVAWMTGDLPTHTQKVVERTFCFKYNTECNYFKKINVLWCTDGENPEFYIYELKPTLKDFGYCVIE